MLAARRAVAMITTPTFYLAFFGGGQLLWLFTQRAHFGSVVPLAAAIVLGALLVWLRRDGEWPGKSALLVVAVALMLIAPMVGAMIVRQHVGLTFEYDGLAKSEVAVDRLLHGEPIYGISWKGTQVDGYAYIFGGLEVRHFNHLPLTVLPGIPIRVLTLALGLPFDYRMVLVPFVVIGLVGVSLLPVPPAARFMVGCAVFLNPALATITVTGHDDITFIAVGLLGLALVARRWPALGCLAFGCAAALKPFGALAIPLVLVILWGQWREAGRVPRRQAILCGVALAGPGVLSMLPFVLWNAGAFYRDVVLFSNGGISDAYPISGYGLGALLVAIGALRPSDYFPFGLLQVAALAPLLLLAWRTLRRRATLGRFMALYTLCFFAFAFTARFFAHNYVSTLLAMTACIVPLGATAIPAEADVPVGTVAGRRAA